MFVRSTGRAVGVNTSDPATSRERGTFGYIEGSRGRSATVTCPVESTNSLNWATVTGVWSIQKPSTATSRGGPSSGYSGRSEPMRKRPLGTRTMPGGACGGVTMSVSAPCSGGTRRPLVEPHSDILRGDAHSLDVEGASRQRAPVCVAMQAFDVVLLVVAVSAVQLDGEIGDRLGHLVGGALGDRGRQRAGRAPTGARRGGVDHQPGGLDLHHHVRQCALHE